MFYKKIFYFNNPVWCNCMPLTLMTQWWIPLFSFALFRDRDCPGGEDEQDLSEDLRSRGMVNGGSVEAQQTPEDTETQMKRKWSGGENSQPEEEDEDGDECSKPLHFPWLVHETRSNSNYECSNMKVLLIGLFCCFWEALEESLVTSI